MSADILAFAARGMLAASAAIVLVLALRGLARAWFGASVAYAFWLLVPAAAIATYLPARAVLAQAPQMTARSAAADPAGAAIAAPFTEPAALASVSFADFAPVFLFVWMAGAVFSLMLVLLDQQRTLERVKLRREGKLYRADDAGFGPALVGVLRPRIVVPADFEQRYSETERMLVLAHEEAHLSASDAQINGLAALARCLNWFNPLFYWASSALRVDQELACDERVMRQHAHARRDYAEAMLKTQLAASAIPLGCQWPAPGAQLLKQRIIMLGRPQPKRAARALGIAACSAVVGLAGASAWALQPPQVAYAEARGGETHIDTDSNRETSPHGGTIARALGSQLVEALQEGDTAQAHQLINAGADVNHFREGDGTALIMAVRLNDAPMATTLIEAGADVNGPAPGDGNPLIVAASMGEVEMIALLVRAGADVNAIVRGDETPLINAARENRLAAARYLIEHGADVNLAVEAPIIGGAEMRSPMSMASRGGHAEMIELLRQHGARN